MPAAGIIPGSLAILKPSNHSLSSCRAITGHDLFRPFSVSSFSLTSPAIIRMGGGPRTFPGGVSKWQWKRMQAKKAQQLLKARLCRERQLYEMRKRAELKAAISELERPWEVVDRAPVLFSVSADEQVKVLADRFQRPCGFDMWSARDGPQIFLSPEDLPSARFFPKGAAHSLKPYSVVSDEGEMRYDDWIARGAGGIGRRRPARRVLSDSSSSQTISYRSDSEHLVAESMEEKKEMAGLLHRHDRNHGPHEPDVAGLTTESSSANGRSSASHLSESEISLPKLKLEGREMASGGFKRRGGREIRGGNQFSYRSQSVLPVTCLGMKEDQMSNGIDRFAGRNGNRGSFRSYSTLSVAGSEKEGGKFGRRGGHGQNGVFQFSNSKFGAAGSRMDDGGMDESFSPRGGHGGRRRGRGGFRGSYRPYSDDDSRIGGGPAGDRDGNHSSFRSYSTPLVAGSEREGGKYGRRGGHGQNGVFQYSNSKFGVAGSRMDDRGMDESFSRNGGRRRGRGGFRGSYRPYSDDDSRIGRGPSGDRDGNHGSSRDPSSSDSDDSVARQRTEGDYITGGFVRHRGRGSRIGNGGVAMSGGVGRGGGRGGYRASYRSVSDLVIAGSRRAREMGMDSRFGGSDKDYKGATRVSLRPTTDLRWEEGGHGRRDRR